MARLIIYLVLLSVPLQGRREGRGRGEDGLLSLKIRLINVQVRSLFCRLSSFLSQKTNHAASISQVGGEQTYFISPCDGSERLVRLHFKLEWIFCPRQLQFVLLLSQRSL